MKYYSELLKKCFDTAKECEKAEDAELSRLEKEKNKEEKLKAEKTARADEINKAYKEKCEAHKKWYQLVQKFIDDYGAYHYTYSIKDDFFDNFFR